jgi:hypothetical protein
MYRNNKKKCFLLLIIIITISILPACSGKRGANLHTGETALTDDDIIASYQSAVEAYGWFNAATMPVDYSDKRILDGYEYFRVTHDTIKSYADLKSYLQDRFADDIVEALLAGDGTAARYRDIGGSLYAISADRGSDITKGKETYEIVRESDTKIICRVFVEIYDDPASQTVSATEQYDFPYEYINGRWVFTSFELIR